MSQEIERKFLVTGEYKSRAYEQSRIVQGYISSARGRTVRVRIRNGKGYLTIKGASDASGLSRYEWEDEAFEKPDFIGREVTGDVRYYNSQLMKHPYTVW